MNFGLEWQKEYVLFVSAFSRRWNCTQSTESAMTRLPKKDKRQNGNFHFLRLKRTSRKCDETMHKCPVDLLQPRELGGRQIGPIEHGHFCEKENFKVWFSSSSGGCINQCMGLHKSLGGDDIVANNVCGFFSCCVVPLIATAHWLGQLDIGCIAWSQFSFNS